MKKAQAAAESNPPQSHEQPAKLSELDADFERRQLREAAEDVALAPRKSDREKQTLSELIHSVLAGAGGGDSVAVVTLERIAQELEDVDAVLLQDPDLRDDAQRSDFLQDRIADIKVRAKAAAELARRIDRAERAAELATVNGGQ